MGGFLAMVGVVAQSVSDLPVVQEFSRRVDLVGVLILFFVCLWKRVLVFGWQYDAVVLQRDEFKAIADKLIAVSMRSLDVVPVPTRREP